MLGWRSLGTGKETLEFNANAPPRVNQESTKRRRRRAPKLDSTRPDEEPNHAGPATTNIPCRVSINPTYSIRRWNFLAIETLALRTITAKPPLRGRTSPRAMDQEPQTVGIRKEPPAIPANRLPPKLPSTRIEGISEDSAKATNQPRSQVCTIWGAPLHFLDIAEDAISNLIGPLKREAAETDELHSQVICAARLQVAALHNEIQSLREKESSYRESLYNAIETIENAMRDMIASASSHLRNQDACLSLPPIKDGSPEIQRNQLLTLEDHLKAAEAAKTRSSMFHSQILASTRPQNPFWPTKSEMGWLLALCILIFGAIGASIGGFLGFLLWGGVVYAAGSAFRHRRPVSIMVDRYNLIRELNRVVAYNAKAYRMLLEKFKTESIDAGIEIQKRLAALRDIESVDIPRLEQTRKHSKALLGEKYQPLHSKLTNEIKRLVNFSGYSSFPIRDPAWLAFQPSATSEFAGRFGTLISQFGTKEDPASDLNLELPLSIPALVPFPEERGLLIHADAVRRKEVVACIESLLVRMLAATPPGKLRLTFIDPIGLGSSAAGFMPLGDHDESLINSRAWSEPQHIEAKLAEITEHMETVIQKYLRNDYRNIHEYNTSAGEIAEPFRIIVVFDFPANFTDASSRRLVSIARNGPRCGVFTFIVYDKSIPLPYGFTMNEFRETCETLLPRDPAHWIWNRRGLEADNWLLKLDEPFPDQIVKTVTKTVGELAKDSMRVEVPYEKLLEKSDLNEENWWAATSADSVRIPLGPCGANKRQFLTLGEGMEHHALIVGRPGSGKSNLMHIIITTLALKYSPDELQLYLIDFKKGVEFKPYADAKLPHALAIAVDGEREFAFSVIERLDKEFTRRGEQFNEAGVNNLAEFRKMNPRVRMPRILLMIDEFQELFSQQDGISRQSADLLDRIVRQGRAFGLHVMLGTQTLKRSMELNSSTFDQMAVRIALQCSDADSRLILAEDNPAARYLSRPGEAIYNNTAGLIEGNNRFQVARLDDLDRPGWLEVIRSLWTKRSSFRNRDIPEPIVFEGRESARLERCRPLAELVRPNAWPTPSKGVDLFLGEPIAISPPVAMRLRRQSGNNLLAITRDESEGVGILLAAATTLLVTYPPGMVRLKFINFATADEPTANFAPFLSDLLPDRVTTCGRQKEVPSLLSQVADLARGRAEGAPSKENFVLVLIGLHRMKALRENGTDDDGFNAVDSLRTILREGPESGIHVMAWCDTWPNANLHLDGRMHKEFGHRVAGVMNEDDSRWFLDDAGAARLSANRCLYYDEDRPGQLVKFRPYSPPPAEWLSETLASLSLR